MKTSKKQVAETYEECNPRLKHWCCWEKSLQVKMKKLNNYKKNIAVTVDDLTIFDNDHKSLLKLKKLHDKTMLLMRQMMKSIEEAETHIMGTTVQRLCFKTKVSRR